MLIYNIVYSIFFNLFIPLHKEGVFKYYISQVIIERNRKVISFENRLKNFIYWAQRLDNAVRPFYASYPVTSRVLTTTSSLGSFIAPIFYNWIFKKPINMPPALSQEACNNSSTTQKIAEAVLGQQKGFNNYYINWFNDSLGKAGYDVGSSLGNFSRGLSLGVLSRWETEIKEGAQKIDHAINNRKSNNVYKPG